MVSLLFNTSIPFLKMLFIFIFFKTVGNGIIESSKKNKDNALLLKSVTDADDVILHSSNI